MFVGEKSHAKAQSREEDRKAVEGFFTLRAFFASLRLCVSLPFSFPPRSDLLETFRFERRVIKPALPW
ncbi:MAG TPA: hypothetical protein VJ715_14320, partial [Pyrinomonadaceae bacterium]|nr:hypothetical protein [Pyrinomonadaceae bacterium]